MATADGTESSPDDPRGSLGWSAYTPLEGAETPVHPPVTYLRLDDDEHAGPYATHDDYVGDDPDDVVEGWSVDPGLHRDVFAWHARAARRPGCSDLDGSSPLFSEKQSLLSRLADDAPPGLLRHHLWSGLLTLIETALEEEIMTWVAHAPRFHDHRADELSAVRACEDRGDDLAHRLRAVLGDDWRITTVP